MITGLPQGFVRFNTLACRILILIHQCGPLRLIDIREELEADRRAVSTTLIRLQECGFVHPYGKVSKYKTGDTTQMVYGLDPFQKLPRYRQVSDAARQAKLRQAKKLKVSSVFDFRGSMTV